jgi:membrane protease YdiL (CAAX protease family)
LALGGVLVIVTRACVDRFSWAQRLHRELQPVARLISAWGVPVLALLSALGEELFFRGLLQPVIGLWLQALLFGALHQIPGRSRWVWVSWAALVGLALGLIFQLTGSLLGPIAAHALVNGMNLTYLKNRDLGPQGRGLGGLLGQRT